MFVYEPPPRSIAFRVFKDRIPIPNRGKARELKNTLAINFSLNQECTHLFWQ